LFIKMDEVTRDFFLYAIIVGVSGLYAIIVGAIIHSFYTRKRELVTHKKAK